MARLGEVCIFFAGTGFPNQYQGHTSGEYPFFKVGDISRNVQMGQRTLEYCDNYINDEIVKIIRGTIIPQGTVVFAKIGEALRLNRRAITTCKCLIDNNVIGLKPIDGVLTTEYFYYLMTTLDLQKYCETTTVPSVRKSTLEKIEIAVPSIEEQNSIVGILNKINDLISLRKQQLAKLDELVKARFVEMFAMEDFPMVSISEVVDRKIVTAKKRFSSTDTIKYVDISSIDNQTNTMTGYTEYIFSDAPSRAQQCIEAGDILISTVRPNLKNIALNRLNHKSLVASSGFCVLRPVACQPSYLLAIALSEKFTNDMIKATTGANYPAIKDSDILKYNIPLAPDDQQQQFALFTDKVTQQKLTIQQSLDKLEVLKKSLMQEYFG